MTPLVSVIIPNYNHAPYLRERINSVLTQEFQDYEIILMDDHSTDESLEIINDYTNNPHVTHIVINEQNSGSPFEQWRKGISMATGKYIWIAESDDVAHAQFLNVTMTQLEKNPKAAVAFTHSCLIDQDGNRLNYGWHEENDGTVKTFEGRRFVIKKMLTSNYIYNASMAVFRKSAYEAIDSTYNHYHYCGDWIFWMALCLQGDVIEIYNILNSYRQHQGQTTLLSEKTGEKWIEVGSIMKEALGLLNLNTIQYHCLCGRLTKRFSKVDLPNRDKVLQQHADIFSRPWADILLYEIGKNLFGFLRS